jgi:hypothetical protein
MFLGQSRLHGSVVTVVAGRGGGPGRARPGRCQSSVFHARRAVAVSCSTHRQTASQFGGIEQNAAPADNPDEQFVPTPDAYRLIDASEQPVVLRLAEPEADLRFSHRASSFVSIVRVYLRQAGALNGNGGGKAQSGNMSDSSRARSRRRAAPARNASTKDR